MSCSAFLFGFTSRKHKVGSLWIIVSPFNTVNLWLAVSQILSPTFASFVARFCVCAPEESVLSDTCNFSLDFVSFDLKQLDVFRKHFGTFTKVFLSMLMAHTPTFQRKTRARADFRIFRFSVLDRKEKGGSFTPCSISSNLLGSFVYLCSPCFSHIFLLRSYFHLFRYI